MSNRDEIIGKLQVRLIRFVSSKYRMTKEDSEDIAQETMLILLRERYRHLESESDLVPLALAIAKLKGLEVIRGSRRFGELPENFDPVSPSANAQDHLLAKEIHVRAQEWLKWLRGAVLRMNPGCRRLLELRLMGRSTQEISEELGKTENNVLVKEHRCRKAMRGLLPEGAQR